MGFKFFKDLQLQVFSVIFY